MSTPDDPTRDGFLQELLDAGMDVEQVAELASLLPQLAPAADTRDRLMATVSQGGRLHRFADVIAELLDIDVDGAKALLDGIDDPASWGPGPGDGVSLFHISGGPAVANAITGFIGVDRGKFFPEHGHLGDEVVAIVQGRCRDTATGAEYGPGDVVRSGPDSTHRVEVLPGPKLIYLAVVFGGLKVGVVELRPGDSRI